MSPRRSALSRAAIALVAAGALALGLAVFAGRCGDYSATPAGAGTDAQDESLGRAGRCDHPFLPAALGTSWRYELSAADERATLAIEVADIRQHRDGEAEVHLRYEATPEGLTSIVWTGTATCSARDGAEETWLAPFHRLVGGRVRHGWRWPAVLSPGTTIAGTATIRSADPVDDRVLEMERAHRVERRETVSGPSGEIEAWLVTFDETDTYDGTSETTAGRLWLAEDVGLVRLELASDDGSYTMRLVEYVRAR